MSKIPGPLEFVKAQLQQCSAAVEQLTKERNAATQAATQAHAQKQMLLQVICGLLHHLGVEEYLLPASSVDAALLTCGYRLTTNVGEDEVTGERVVKLVTTPLTDEERLQIQRAQEKRDDDPKESRIIVPGA